MTQALLDDGHRAIGLCNVAIGLQRWLASRLDVSADRVELEASRPFLAPFFATPRA